jgi:hypothetical protein
MPSYELPPAVSFPSTSMGQLGRDSLNGKIGNGGCTLSLTNSNGSIEVLKLAK